MMDEAHVRFVIGPAYFGDPRLARHVFEILLQAALGDTVKVITNAERTEDPRFGIFAEVAATASHDTKKMVEAAIMQAMLLPATVPCEVIFEEYDVMVPDYADPLFEAVKVAQSTLRDVGNALAAQFTGYW